MIPPLLKLESRPFRWWPGIRWTRSGAIVVKGRYVTRFRWRVLNMICRWSVRVFAVSLVAAAFLPALPVMERMGRRGGAATMIVHWLFDVRLYVRNLLVEENPQVGAFLHYSGRNPYDWHLAGVGVVILIFGGLISVWLAWLISMLAWPIVSRRLKLIFTPQRVEVYRWWGRLRLPRGEGATEAISFRVESTSDKTPDQGSQGSGSSNPDGSTEALVMHGLRSHRLAAPVNGKLSARIVAACHFAMKQTRSIHLGHLGAGV